MIERNIKDLSTRCRQLHIAAEALDWLHESGVITTGVYMRADSALWQARAAADNVLSEMQLMEELT